MRNSENTAILCSEPCDNIHSLSKKTSSSDFILPVKIQVYKAIIETLEKGVKYVES